jgi:hypothetical protein
MAMVDGLSNLELQKLYLEYVLVRYVKLERGFARVVTFVIFHGDILTVIIQERYE